MTKAEARYVLADFNWLRQRIESLLELSRVTGDLNYREQATQLAIEARRLPVEWARNIRYSSDGGGS